MDERTKFELKMSQRKASPDGQVQRELDAKEKQMKDPGE